MSLFIRPASAMRIVTLMGLCLAIIGCVDNYNNVSFYVSGNVAPDKSNCTFALGGDLLYEGVLDIGFNRFEYLLHPLYNNQIISKESTGPLMTNTSVVQVQGAVISILDKDRTNSLFPDFTTPTMTTVPSGKLDTPGQAIGSVVIVPREFFTDSIRNQITASRPLSLQVSMRPFGMTNGGKNVESGEWFYTVTVCKGCLIHCVAMVANENANCIVGQDTAVDTVCM